MPLQDVKCIDCDFIEERIFKLSTPPPPCRDCGSPTEKVQSAQFGFSSSSGFYNKDASPPKRTK